jgi:anti-anti-sigma regulatory factor
VTVRIKWLSPGRQLARVPAAAGTNERVAMSADVFLIHDHQLFELAVRGQLNDRQSTAPIAEALRHLPRECLVAIDLSVVESLSAEASHALVDLVREPLMNRPGVVIVSSEPIIRARLDDAGLHHVAALVWTLDEARRMPATLA